MEQSILIRLYLAPGMPIFKSHQPHITVGSTSDCALRLTQAAPQHALIEWKEGVWFLTDLGSPIGTKLNGIPMRPNLPQPLKENDEIFFGTFCVTVLQLSIAKAPVLRTISSGYDPTQEAHAPSSATHCIICGRVINDTFCPYCGYRVPAPPTTSEPTLPPIDASMMPPRFSDASRPILVPPAPPTPPPAPPYPATSPKKQEANQKPGFFSSLFKKKDSPKKQLLADDVQFRAAAPASLTRGEYFTVKVMMYREDDHQRADREQLALADKVKSASSSIFQAAKNESFRIALQSPDIPMDTETANLVWNGIYATADMEVLLPENYDRRQLRLTGRIYSGIAVLTDLKLTLQVDSPAPQQPVVEKCRMCSAFISYASQDRAKVVARIQGIQLSRPDMDLFFDAESLRRGEHWEQRLYKEIEDRDLFYLFWSRNAAGSSWVSKELEFAMEHKGPAAVEPVPLEDPAICPPPACLQDRHFNDWTLRYLRDQ